MKVYVASAFTQWREAARAAALLWDAGHICTSRWIKVAEELDGECARVPVGDPRRVVEANKDVEDLWDSDVFLLLVPETGGTGCWFELGFAYGMGTHLIVVGPPSCLERTVFLELDSVQRFDTVEEAIASLEARAA